MTKKSPHKQVDLVIAYKNFFSTEEGKTVLYDMMKASGMMVSSFDENPYLMAKNEGHRESVLRILQILKKDAQQLRKFIEEQEEKEDVY